MGKILFILCFFIYLDLTSSGDRDFGPGIDAALLENIKKPFVQGKQDKNKGFGLGLSICNKVVLAHSGEFVIKNNKDGGASFIIRVPR